MAQTLAFAFDHVEMNSEGLIVLLLCNNREPMIDLDLSHE